MKKREISSYNWFFGLLARFSADVSMMSWVGSGPADVIGEVAGSDWSTGMVKWQDRSADGRAQGLT